jgi:hypothetical protein
MWARPTFGSPQGEAFRESASPIFLPYSSRVKRGNILAKTQPIEWAKQYNTGQIYSTGPELSIVTEDGKQLGPGVRCKDFLHDTIWGRLNDRTFTIYGYNFDESFKDQMWEDRPRVLLSHPSRTISDDAETMKDFMNQIEGALSISKPSFYRIPASLPSRLRKGGALMWIGDPVWMIAPPAFSLWVLLLRNAHLHQQGESWEKTINSLATGETQPGQKNDSVFLKFAVRGIEHMINKGGIAEVFSKNINDNYPSSIGHTTLHHFGGIVSFSDQSNRAAFEKHVAWDWPNTSEKAPSVAHS